MKEQSYVPWASLKKLSEILLMPQPKYVKFQSTNCVNEKMGYKVLNWFETLLIIET